MYPLETRADMYLLFVLFLIYRTISPTDSPAWKADGWGDDGYNRKFSKLPVSS